MSRLVAIGDVHGCASELLTLLERLALTPDTTLVFIGDYVDRGPHSRQVIDLVLEASRRCHVVPLMGNHEAMFLDFLLHRNADTAGLFVFNGGGTTLGSYADDSGDYYVPREHIRFLKGLRMTHETEGFFFVHAGVPDVPLEEVDPVAHRDELLWGRQLLSSTRRWNKVIVHGHSRVKEVDVRPNRINIDTGCVYDNSLSAIELPSMTVTSVPRLERVRGAVLHSRSSRRRAVRFKGALAVQVQHGEELLTFETLDYSPIGMFIRLVTPSRHRPLMIAEEISGVIGPDRPGSVRFRGIVVRELVSQQGLFYGVQISHLE